MLVSNAAVEASAFLAFLEDRIKGAEGAEDVGTAQRQIIVK